MNRTLQSFLAIVLVLGVGLGLWYAVVAIEEPPPAAPPRDLGPVPIGVETVRARTLKLEIDAFGNLEPRRKVTLSTEVSGRIASVHAGWRPGATVEAGALLIEIDPRLFELDVATATAARDEALARVAAVEVDAKLAARIRERADEGFVVATREYERLVDLAGFETETRRDAALNARIAAERARDNARGAVEGQAAALVSAKARVASAEVALERAREMLARTKIRAPFRGRLRGQAPGIGTLASPGTPLAELIDPTSLILAAKVPERDLALLVPGMSASLRFPSNPETADGPLLPARVVAIDAVSDPVTRRGVVEIELADPGAIGGLGMLSSSNADGVNGHGEPSVGVLPSGLFAQATIDVATLEDVTWIARRQFVWEDGRPVAYVVARAEAGGEASRESFVAERRELELVREVGEGFVVGSGLEVGDTLILAPLDRMSAGVEVRVLETLEQRAESTR